MAPAGTHSVVDDHGEKQRDFNREVREMASNLTTRLGLIRKGGSTSTQHHEVADDHGSSVITLAGTNTGATMRAELNGKSSKKVEDEMADDEDESLSSYVNSNFQAINNSIMFGGSYTGNDPGVHMDLSDLYDDHGHKGSTGKKLDKQNDDGGNWFSKEY